MTPSTADDSIYFQDSKSASIRLWHWLVVVFFFASVITVLFGSTLFKTKANVPMVQEQVQRMGGTLTEKQARSVAHEYSDKMWMLHKYIGYGLSLLLLWRIIIEYRQSKEKRMVARFRSAMQYPGISPEKNHFKMVQYTYFIFYGLFLLLAITGLVLAYEDIEFLKPIHEPAEEIHGFVQYGVYGFMIFHLVGVIRADMGRYGGIVSRMINGK